MSVAPDRSGFFGVFGYSRRAVSLVWSTNRPLTLAIAGLTALAGVLPAAVAWVGARIVDAVVTAIASTHDPQVALRYVLIEGVLVAALAIAQRLLSLCQSLLRAQLGQRVNVMIFEKALTLELAHFEDSDFYDKLTRAARGLEPPAIARDAHLRSRAERRVDRELRGSARALLAVGSRRAGARGPAGISG